MRAIIEKGEGIANGRKELATLLEVHPQALTDAKKGKCGLPTHACAKLAEITGNTFAEVVAASELATEKKPERREFWQKILGQSVTAGVVLVAVLMNAPGEVQAAQFSGKMAAHAHNSGSMYIMSNLFYWLLAVFYASIHYLYSKAFGAN